MFEISREINGQENMVSTMTELGMTEGHLIQKCVCVCVCVCVFKEFLGKIKHLELNF
jgi:hypothetical protein